jgi:mannosyl-oligosaccharide glucosidase
MNWMALRSLHEIYAKEEGPYQQKAAEVYDALRTAVVKNVVKVWFLSVLR